MGSRILVYGFGFSVGIWGLGVEGLREVGVGAQSLAKPSASRPAFASGNSTSSLNNE